ncbi:radical SAM protein [Streptomyces sp. 378]|uniref:radical SAM protein n=1 Tax=Streptomyces sp. 378 TaxID=3049412 RepID=UPI0024C351B8|nr:radical SAM protein [Streptomyces sp. 378]MDK1341854.1 radical SAM protein [Streptomyces sp. 378]
MRDYYRRSYARMRGYYMPPHFMEIPYWIPIVASMLPDEHFRKELMIVDDLDVAHQRIAEAAEGDLFFFSALDANVEQLLHLAPTGATMIVGGYVDPDVFAEFPNVSFLRDVTHLPVALPRARPQTTLDYRLFNGLKCIPRFSMSSGCSFRCKFCTVPTQVVPAAPEGYEAEIAAFAPLDFRLAFVDDKSFGDPVANNWRDLGTVRDIFITVHENFEGFIIQTPPSLAARPGFLADCRDMGVRYVEFGVETANDSLLKYLRKPFRTKHLYAASEIVRDLGLYVIPNFIMGIPGDDYKGTVEWVQEFVDIMPAVNVNWLAAHFGNERGDLDLPVETFGDRDQNTVTKSWLADDDVAAGLAAVQDIYAITEDYWRDRVAYPSEQVTVR